MRVLIDIQAAMAQRAGVGRYTKSLVEHLAAWANGDEIRLFYFDFRRKGQPFVVPGATERAIHWCPGRIVQKAWKTIGWPPFDWFAGRADVYHFPNFVRPPLRRGHSVVTIHDTSFLRWPDTLEAGNLEYLTGQMKRTVRDADAIITNSAFTAREVEELLKVRQEKIFPILLGLADGIRRPSDAAIAEGRQRLKLERPYLLMVSTLEPRKNVELLVDVFERLGDFHGDLVIAGGRGWKYGPILERMRNSSRASDIRHLAYVGEDLLPALYAGAELFVFPSLYEGFGFPPLEAMACGTPVISSNTASLPEVVGDAAELVDGFDADHWAARVRGLLSDSRRRAQLRAKGLERARQFSWDDTARKTWGVYRMFAP